MVACIIVVVAAVAKVIWGHQNKLSWLHNFATIDVRSNLTTRLNSKHLIGAAVFNFIPKDETLHLMLRLEGFCLVTEGTGLLFQGGDMRQRF